MHDCMCACIHYSYPVCSMLSVCSITSRMHVCIRSILHTLHVRIHLCITTVSMYGVHERMYISMKEAMYMSPSAQRSSGVMYITIHPYMLCPYVQCTLLHLLMYDTHIIVWRGVSSLHSSAYHLREIWSRDRKEISGSPDLPRTPIGPSGWSRIGSTYLISGPTPHSIQVQRIHYILNVYVQGMSAFLSHVWHYMM